MCLYRKLYLVSGVSVAFVQINCHANGGLW